MIPVDWPFVHLPPLDLHSFYYQISPFQSHLICIPNEHAVSAPLLAVEGVIAAAAGSSKDIVAVAYPSKSPAVAAVPVAALHHTVAAVVDSTVAGPAVAAGNRVAE